MQAFCILLMIGFVCFLIYQDYLETGGIILAMMMMFLVIGVAMWFIMSLFGWIPSGGIVPPGPQIFNLSVGVT